MQISSRRVVLFLTALILPTLFHRIYLGIAPHTNFDIGPYNIHHLFTGLLFITLGGVPLAILRGRSWILELAMISFGVGLSLALDEWVYLIATDGSDESYLSPVSLWGAVVMLGLACIYVLGIWAAFRFLKRPDQSVG